MMRKRYKNIDIKIVFDRKHAATKSSARNRKEGSVQIEVYYDRRRVFFSTGVKVYTDQFRNGRVYNHGQEIAYNKRIKIMLDSINNFINEALEKGEGFSLDALKKYMSNASSGSDTSFLDFMQKSIGSRDISDTTRYVQMSIFHKLKEWGKIKSFSDITVENISAWHLQSTKVVKKANFSTNYDRVLKTYVRMAVRYGLIKSNPYDKLKLPTYTPTDTHRSLSLDDLKKIEAVTLESEAEIKTRDLFLFQANTGLAYVDTQNFDIDEVIKNRGRLTYQNKRIKTSEPFYIPLNQTARRVLKKYNNKLPKIPLTLYNKRLKVIAQKVGVKAPISSHWARHTFAMICLNNGMPIEILAKILGHSNIKTTQIYAKIQYDAVEREFDKVMKQLEKR